MFGGLSLILFGFIFIVFTIVAFCSPQKLKPEEGKVAIWILIIGIMMVITGSFSIDAALADRNHAQAVSQDHVLK